MASVASLPQPLLSAKEKARYGRHLVLPEVGLRGQERLKEARVLVVGTGGLGSPITLYLAAAGVCKLVLVDFDHVEESNLQRQILFGQADLGRPKVEVAAERLRGLNPWVEIDPRPVRFSPDNARELVESVDLVIDGTDNFPARYLINDACVLFRRPFVYGSIYRFEGQVALFATPDGPCYRCLFPQPPPDGLVPNCAEGGVLGVLPGMIGSIQASEAIKHLIGAGETLRGRLLIVDALTMRVREVRVPRDPHCPVCGSQPTIRELREEAMSCENSGGPLEPGESAGELAGEMTVEEFAALRQQLPGLQLIDVRTPQEWELARLPGATLVPLAQLASRLGEFDPAVPTVVYCHVGGRSAAAVRFLRGQGFDRIANLSGGIEAWSLRVDPSVPRY